MFVDRFFRFLPRGGLKKALKSFNRGDYRKACREFEEYNNRRVSINRGTGKEMVRMYMVESYIEHSKNLSSEKKFDKAAIELEKAIELEPSYADVHYSLGALYGKLGRTLDARECFSRALTINPNYFRARVMLAKSYNDDGASDDAVRALEACLSAAPIFYIEKVKELIDLIRGESSTGEQGEIFRMLLEEKPSSSQVSKQRALESMQNGDYDFALAELKKALSLNPNYPDIHNLLGIAYSNKGMIDDAIMEFETALKIHPDYLKAHLNMALNLYEKGAGDKAIEHLEKVLELDPENELAMNLLQELQPVAK